MPLTDSSPDNGVPTPTPPTTLLGIEEQCATPTPSTTPLEQLQDEVTALRSRECLDWLEAITDPVAIDAHGPVVHRGDCRNGPWELEVRSPGKISCLAVVRSQYNAAFGHG